MQKLLVLAWSLIRQRLMYLWSYGSTGYSWSGWVSSNENGNNGATSTAQYANVLGYTTNGAAGRRCTYKVDLTNKKTITCKYSYSHGSNGTWNCQMYIHTSLTTSSNNATPTNSGSVGLGTGTNLTRSLDVSGYSGEYYIQFYVGKGTYYDTGGFNVYEVVIE